ncbi:hypothetical protein IQ265_00790 [Nodosilinea sp. LEGE 06152]|uniref:hypothetical protein n=1 Tax=Nodosilinea sp. LEGE 06152 TaxID=2777966 RepID=UPI00187E101E|nr:hypothetical protein [Nodosilinea sp. LEGE 06152]MBE9155384.1 hypothetical protein [Nodosilinea sp. LEGE 06152]
MAVPRYYRVLTGARGITARQKYLDFLAGAQERALDPGVGEDRPESVALYVKPFAFPLPASHVLRESALSPSWEHCRNIAPTQQFVTAALGDDTAITIRSYKPARIIRTQKGPRQAQKRSDITGLPYRPYNNRSRSIPFGKNLANDTVASVGATLIAAYATTGFSARITPERT